MSTRQDLASPRRLVDVHFERSGDCVDIVDPDEDQPVGTGVARVLGQMDLRSLASQSDVGGQCAARSGARTRLGTPGAAYQAAAAPASTTCRIGTTSVVTARLRSCSVHVPSLADVHAECQRPSHAPCEEVGHTGSVSTAVALAAMIAGTAAIVWGAETFAEHLADASKRLGVTAFALALLLAGAEPEELATVVTASAPRRRRRRVR